MFQISPREKGIKAGKWENVVLAKRENICVPGGKETEIDLYSRTALAHS
jgi:hypothetical protein